MSAPKTYTVTCRWGCGTTWETRLKPPAKGIGCSRNPECSAKHNAEVARVNELRRAIAAERRRERTAPAVSHGEWGHMMMLANPGLGSKKAQRRATERANKKGQS